VSPVLARAAKFLVALAVAPAWSATSDAVGDRFGGPLCASPAHLQIVAAAGVFHGVGVVTAVNRAKGWLTLDHDAIKGFMAAMEMMYRVDPPSLAATLRVGDRVAFDIDSASETIVGVNVIASAKP
jgi:Cu/Ag efflux protein CusF